MAYYEPQANITPETLGFVLLEQDFNMLFRIHLFEINLNPKQII